MRREKLALKDSKEKLGIQERKALLVRRVNRDYRVSEEKRVIAEKPAQKEKRAIQERKAQLAHRENREYRE